MSSRIEQAESGEASPDAPASGARASADETPDGVPVIGQVLAGKYRVERVLGAGGMGAVLAAMHLQLGERVALKFLLPAMANQETLERFGREARAAARIKSEHIARVTDVGTLESGAPYMVMEFLEGSDLAAVLKDQGPLPIRDAVEYVIQACDAIAEAHAIGIVHRDLKPANLFLARRPGAPARVKVLDFGISKILDEQGSPLEQRTVTRTRAWLGSPLYMAPEQMKSARDVDVRTDVWALGVILFELLTRTVPFTGQNLPELCAEILHGTPADVESRRPDAPREIGDVIRRCLQKDPLQRYQNIGELVMALVDFAPRRARSVAERAISLLEQAGMMSGTGQRHALDATMAESVRSPSAMPMSTQHRGTTPIPGPPRTPSFGSMPPPSGFDEANAATMLERPQTIGGPREATSSGSNAWFVPLAVLVTLLVSLGGVFAFLKYRDREATPPAATSEPAQSADAPSGAATPSPSSTVTATASGTPTPSVTPAAEPKAAAVEARPSAAPAPTAAPVRGAVPPRATASAAAQPKGKTATDGPSPPAAGNGDLRIETCTEHLPDGTTRVVPCK